MSMKDLEKKVQNLRELKRLQDELTAEIDAATDELKAYMQASAADELHGPTFKITWKEVTSSRLDGKALKAELPDLWKRFATQTATRRFVLC